MNTIYDTVSGVANAAKEIVVGKPEAEEQAGKSGTEPVAGKEGKTEGDPYDKGNLPTPLASPTDLASSTAPGVPSASSAAHTEPTPPKPDLQSNSSATAASGGAAETNADTSGPAVGNAKLVPEGKAVESKAEAPATTTATTITSPEQAEKQIKEDARAAESKEKPPKIDTSKNTDDTAEISPKTRTPGDAPSTALPTEPEEKKSDKHVTAAASSAAAEGAKLKKRLSTRIKEKLHIGKSKKDKSSPS